MTKSLQRCAEDINVVLVDETLLAQIELCLSGCEACVKNATIALDCLLDALTGYDPVVTEYLMCGPAHCQSCGCEIREKTLVAV